MPANGETQDPVLIKLNGIKPAIPTQPEFKPYNCGVGNSFTLTGKGSYKDTSGGHGTYTFDPASQLLTFHGGSFEGQRAEYRMYFGVSSLHILGPSGRAVIGCE